MSKNSEHWSRKDSQFFIITALVAIFSGVIVAVISGEGRFSAFNPTRAQLVVWIPVASATITVIILAIFRRASLVWLVKAIARGTNKLLTWLVSNWQFSVSAVLLVIVAFLIFLYTQVLWSIAIAVLLYIAIFLSTIWFFRKRQVDETIRRIKCKPVPLHPPGIGNSWPNALLAAPGTLEVDNIEFLLGDIFDTGKQVRYVTLNPDGSHNIEQRLPEPQNNIKCVHLLINTGNSKKEFEWSTIGKVNLVFDTGEVQSTPLVLGDNVREWAIGNKPGSYVDRLESDNTKVAWKGHTKENRYAVIDHLKISVSEENKAKKLTSIIFHHASPHNMDKTNGVQLLVFAISLELE